MVTHNLIQNAKPLGKATKSTKFKCDKISFTNYLDIKTLAVLALAT